MKTNSLLNYWANDSAEDDAMTDDHGYLWQRMIELVGDIDLRGKTVLDFGCNQGGFLRMLYETRPFARGYGVDLARSSVALAEARKGSLPLHYSATDTLAHVAGQIDAAFSHEVLYLIPDLMAHAGAIRSALRPGGVYYAAIGCHVDNPLWPQWRELIASYSNLPVQDYSLEDYAKSFYQTGFRVEVCPYLMDGFAPIKPNNPYFPRIADSIAYHTQHKVLFRFSKV